MQLNAFHNAADIIKMVRKMPKERASSELANLFNAAITNHYYQAAAAYSKALMKNQPNDLRLLFAYARSLYFERQYQKALPELLNSYNLYQIISNDEKLSDDEKSQKLIPDSDYRNLLQSLITSLLFTDQYHQAFSFYELFFYAGAKERADKINLQSFLDIAPKWQGQELDDKKILLWDHQGLGDMVFAINIVPRLSQMAREITICADPRMVAIYQQNFADFDNIKVIAKPENAQEFSTQNFDYQCNLFLSLKYLQTSKEDFINNQFQLKANPKLTGELKNKYHKLFPKHINIALTWHSSSTASGDRRSIALESLLPLLELSQSKKQAKSLPKITFHNAQYGDWEEEIAELKQKYNIEIYCDPDVDVNDDLEAHLAALDAMDLVVTIDNTTAHFAAALGKQTILFAPVGNDWRWFYDENNNSIRYGNNVYYIQQEHMFKWDNEVQHAKDMIMELLP